MRVGFGFGVARTLSAGSARTGRPAVVADLERRISRGASAEASTAMRRRLNASRCSTTQRSKIDRREPAREMNDRGRAVGSVISIRRQCRRRGAANAVLNVLAIRLAGDRGPIGRRDAVGGAPKRRSRKPAPRAGPGRRSRNRAGDRAGVQRSLASKASTAATKQRRQRARSRSCRGGGRRRSLGPRCAHYGLHGGQLPITARARQT